MPKSPVDAVLETYRHNVKSLIATLSEYDEDEHGFYSSLTTQINRRLGKFGITIPEQYIPDWYNHRKGKARGLDIPSATKLGFGAGLSTDPNMACALVYLALLGVWDLDDTPVEFMIAKLTGLPPEPVTTDDSTTLGRIEFKVDRILDIAESGDHKVTKKQNLTWRIVKELTTYGYPPTKANLPKLEKLLLKDAIGIEDWVPQILKILQSEQDPEPKYWFLICALLSSVNPEGTYTPEVLKTWITHQAKNRDSPRAFLDKPHDK